jgi:hypothetical protein
MASAWGLSWGDAWESAWGAVAGSPAPGPAPPPISATPDGPATVNVAGGVARRRHNNLVWINLDGKRHHVTYQRAAELIEAQAREDAARERAENSKRLAKQKARQKAQDLKARLIIEEPFAFGGFSNDVMADQMFKDLRNVYSQQMVSSLSSVEKMNKQAQEDAAMQAAEAWLMGDGY